MTKPNARKKATAKSAQKIADERAEEPQFGDPILVGTIGSLEVVIRPPLNDAAIRSLSQEQMILLILEYRLRKIEDAVKVVQGKMDLHGRMSSLEAKMTALLED